MLVLQALLCEMHFHNGYTHGNEAAALHTYFDLIGRCSFLSLHSEIYVSDVRSIPPHLIKRPDSLECTQTLAKLFYLHRNLYYSTNAAVQQIYRHRYSLAFWIVWTYTPVAKMTAFKELR